MTIEIPNSAPTTLTAPATPKSESKTQPVQPECERSKQNSIAVPSKAELLAKACDCEPTMFHTIDGWINERPDDLDPDSGVRLASMISYQLMYGADVRVLMRPDLDRESRLRLLQQVLQVERQVGWEYLEENAASEPRATAGDRVQKRLKSELLAQLRTREPKDFHQVDAWTEDPFDGLLPSKIDNRLTSTVTQELASGADLRVLMRPNLDRATRLELIQRIVDFERRVDWEEYERDLVALSDPPRSCDTEIESEQCPKKEGTALLMDRLVLTASFDESEREYLRVQALKEQRPDYGTFLKDEELTELLPEAAESYHVDDIRRALMMIRMILDYGESAFTFESGLAVYDLLSCILEQDDFWFDGTWSANNPAARDPEASVRSSSTADLDFDSDDDDFGTAGEPIEPNEPTMQTTSSGDGGYQVPECFEDNSMRVRAPVPDGERRLGYLLSMLKSDEFRYYTNCFTQPEEIEVVVSVGAWLLGIDPPTCSTERVLNAFGAVWKLVRTHDREVAEALGRKD